MAHVSHGELDFVSAATSSPLIFCLFSLSTIPVTSGTMIVVIAMVPIARTTDHRNL